jgi:hypothetical protein
MLLVCDATYPIMLRSIKHLMLATQINFKRIILQIKTRFIKIIKIACILPEFIKRIILIFRTVNNSIYFWKILISMKK